MKTTAEIADPLLAQVRQLAAQEGTTMRALIEEGLRRVVEERRSAKPFRLRDFTFHGQGLRPELANASWEEIRDLSYEGRGA